MTEENMIDLNNLKADQIIKLKELLGIKEQEQTDINVNLKSKKQKEIKTGQPAFLKLIKGKKKPKIIKIEGYKYIKDGDSLVPQWGAIASKNEYGSKSWKKSSVSSYKEAVRMLGEGEV